MSKMTRTIGLAILFLLVASTAFAAMPLGGSTDPGVTNLRFRNLSGATQAKLNNKDPLGSAAAAAATIDAGAMHLANNETISGFKNFSGGIGVNGKGVSLTGKVLTPAFFGTHYNKATSYSSPQTPFQPLGFGSIRFWDTGTNWITIEATEGSFDWSKLDQLVAFAQANNQQIVMTLGQTPTWAAGGLKDSTYGGNYNSYPPGDKNTSGDDQYWKDYVAAVGNRYKGKIKYYEIWNEPNWSGFWRGTTTQLATLTKDANQVLKAIDPTIKIISACPATTSGVSFLDSYLAAGAAAYVDIVGVHLYVSPAQPEAMIDLAQQYRAVMFKYGIGNLPMWNTETSWLSYYDATSGAFVGNTSTAMPDKQSAGYLIRMYISAWAAGVDRCFHYGMDYGTNIQLVNLSSPSTVTPTGYAIQRFISWAVGKRLLQYKHDTEAGVFQVTAADTNGVPSRFIWTEDTKTGTITVDTSAAPGSLTAWDGSVIYPTSGGSLSVDYSPQLITSNNQMMLGQNVPYTTSIVHLTNAKPLDALSSWTNTGALLYSSPMSEVAGSELIADNYFANTSLWVKPSGWTVSGGMATVSASVATNALYGTSSNSPPSAAGQTYSITMTIASVTSGGFQIAVGSQHGPTHSAPGTYVDKITTTASSTWSIQPTGTTPNGSISYISIKAVTDSPGSVVQDPALNYNAGTQTLSATKFAGNGAGLTNLVLSVPLDQAGTWTNTGGILYTPAASTTYSAEWVQDSGFANSALWGAVSGWSVSGGVATASGPVNSLYTGSSNCAKSVVGHTYRITMTISALTSGGFQTGLVGGGAGNQFGPTHSTPGTYSDNITATGVGTFSIQPVTTPTGSLTYFSVTEVFVTPGSATQDSTFTYNAGTHTLAAQHFSGDGSGVTNVPMAAPLDQASTWTTTGGVVYTPAASTTYSAEWNADPHFAVSGDWGIPSGWAISGGTASATGPTNSLYPSTGTCAKSVTGHTYKITMTISALTSGGFQAGLVGGGAGNQFGPTHSTPGTYSDNITATGVGTFSIQPVTTPTGSLTYFSVTEVFVTPGSATQDSTFTYNAGTHTLAAQHFSGDGSGVTGIPGVPTRPVTVLCQTNTSTSLYSVSGWTSAPTSAYTLGFCSILGGTLGNNGGFRFTLSGTLTSSSNNKTLRVKDSGAGWTFTTNTYTTNGGFNDMVRVMNRGAQNSQVYAPPGLPSFGGNFSAPGTSSIDTTTTRTIAVTGQTSLETGFTPTTANMSGNGSTVTVVYTSHGLNTGEYVQAAGSSTSGYNVDPVQITKIDANTFTYPATGSGTPTTAPTIKRYSVIQLDTFTVELLPGS